MRELIAAFPTQLGEALALEIMPKAEPSLAIANVLICGMGGSAFGGELVKMWTRDSLNVPIQINRGYSLPKYVSEETLAIISSYSGNTEETLEAMRSVGRAQTVCIASGGEATELAESSGYSLIRLPTGLPPRAALAYSAVAQMIALEGAGLIDGAFRNEVTNTAHLIAADQQDTEARAASVALQLAGKLVAIYAPDDLEAVAIRLRQQLAENAKVLSWNSVIPEMNHNELVGWRGVHKDVAAVFLRWEGEHERTKLRISFTKELLHERADSIIEIEAKGDSRIGQSLYLVHLVDWISQLMGEQTGLDTMEVKEIDDLKKHLATK